MLGTETDNRELMDEYRRCRFYPRCMIHMGLPLPEGMRRSLYDVPRWERENMAADYAAGMSTREIGREHNLGYQQVWRAIETIQKKLERS